MLIDFYQAKSLGFSPPFEPRSGVPNIHLYPAFRIFLILKVSYCDLS